jgi:hypothetical protein
MTNTLHILVGERMSAPTTDAHGTTIWRDGDGKMHRDGDLPAAVWPDTQWWCQHGELHRDGDLPAIVTRDGSQVWYQHGKRHRSFDMPAAVHADGFQSWWKHGKLHRDGDLAAVVGPDGRQEWWVEGRKQSDLDREETRRKMAQAARWSPLRAAFVGVAAVVHTKCTRQ